MTDERAMAAAAAATSETNRADNADDDGRVPTHFRDAVKRIFEERKVGKIFLPPRSQAIVKSGGGDKNAPKSDEKNAGDIDAPMSSGADSTRPNVKDAFRLIIARKTDATNSSDNDSDAKSSDGGDGGAPIASGEDGEDKVSLPPSVAEFYTHKATVDAAIDGAIAAATDNRALTPLAIAVEEARYETAKSLLENGANPNDLILSRTDDRFLMYTSTLLHYAVMSGQERMAALLLEHGADVDGDVRFDDTTPLLVALEKQDAPMVTLLLAHNADYRRVCSMGGTAPVYALYAFDYAGCLRLLLDHVEAREGITGLADYVNFESPLLCAPVVLTALTAACVRSNYNCIKVLLESGADGGRRDAYGRLPRDYLTMGAKREEFPGLFPPEEKTPASAHGRHGGCCCLQ